MLKLHQLLFRRSAKFPDEVENNDATGSDLFSIPIFSRDAFVVFEEIPDSHGSVEGDVHKLADRLDAGQDEAVDRLFTEF